MKNNIPGLLNAFCVDLEEWFHIGGANNPYEDHTKWEKEESHVQKDTEVLLKMLEETGQKGTFLTVGWIAEKYPGLIRRISDSGHEIGCHGYYHRIVWEQTPEEFRKEIVRTRKLLQDISGQEVVCFRAPTFSIKKECFWAYPILIEEGIKIDISLVPASRDSGGVIGFTRDPLLLQTDAGEIKIFPVSTMKFAGKGVQFSGGGYLRLFPIPLIEMGFRQNLRIGRPVMMYIHPREVNPDQPRLQLPIGKHFRHYVGLKSAHRKLMYFLKRYRFGTVSEVLSKIPSLPRYSLINGEIRPAV